MKLTPPQILLIVFILANVLLAIAGCILNTK